jgi:sensor histidine kinase YesM
MRWELKHIGKQRILLHSGFWLAWVVSFTVLQSLGQGIETFSVWLRYYVITLPVFIGHTYLIAYWLVPHTFYKNRYGLLIMGVLVLLPVFSVIELIISNELVFSFYGSFSPDETNYLNLKNIIISGIGNHYILLVFFAIKAGQEWYYSQIRKEQELEQNEKAELEIYHYQQQPRLILQLMDALQSTISQNPQKTPELIIHISNFFNLFLKESHADWRPLLAEINLMEKFLDINKLVTHNQLRGEIRLRGNLKPFVVPPFLFLPILGFAVKSGNGCNDSVECIVIIAGENRKLHLAVELRSNKKLKPAVNHDSEMLRMRVQHYFPGKFTLAEENDENFRKLQLEIFY